MWHQILVVLLFFPTSLVFAGIVYLLEKHFFLKRKKRYIAQSQGSLKIVWNVIDTLFEPNLRVVLYTGKGARSKAIKQAKELNADNHWNLFYFAVDIGMYILSFLDKSFDSRPFKFWGYR